MPNDVDQLPVPLFHAAGALEGPYLMAAAETMAGPPPEGGVAPFAVRNPVRTQQVVLVLQRCVGIALAALAWLVMLGGLAHLVLAAVHNRDGELGRGLDDTWIGALACLASAVLAAIGVPLWVWAERRMKATAGSARR